MPLNCSKVEVYSSRKWKYSSKVWIPQNFTCSNWANVLRYLLPLAIVNQTVSIWGLLKIFFMYILCIITLLSPIFYLWIVFTIYLNIFTSISNIYLSTVLKDNFGVLVLYLSISIFWYLILLLHYIYLIPLVISYFQIPIVNVKYNQQINYDVLLWIKNLIDHLYI